MGWTILETTPCDRCGVYCPTFDVSTHLDGTSYCTACGAPSFEVVVPESRKAPPMAIGLGVCAGLFVLVVAIAELATG